MKLNKLDIIQKLPNIKPFSQIERGVSDVKILCLIADINYKSMILLEDNPPNPQINIIVGQRLKVVVNLYKMLDNNELVSRKEYDEIVRQCKHQTYRVKQKC